jgi:hypothetical protein
MSAFSQRNVVLDGTLNATQTGDINVSPTAAAAPPRPAERIRVLMLAANPAGTGRLAIDEEARQITERLRLSNDRDRFDLQTCWAVRPMDLLQYLNQHRPHIVHFSGHGDRGGEILLAGSDGTSRPVSAAALGDLFRVANDAVRVVVLNACYSAAAVLALSQHVDYVVGMNAPITDEAATIFAGAFYSALGFGRPVPAAFDQAVVALALHGFADQHVSELVVRQPPKEKAR